MAKTIPEDKTQEKRRHRKCKGFYDAYIGDCDCNYDTNITCDQCKYGLGGKDPEAIRNRA